MRIVVTGACGFIGTHVCKLLQEHDVTRIDSMEPRVHGDVPITNFIGVHRQKAGHLDPEQLEGIESVIHLAAQVGVADSMNDPARYIVDNTHDTMRFMETLKAMSRRPARIVVASSMSIYGDPRTEAPITEDHPIRPASVYGLTKYDQERIVVMLGRLMGIEVVALRFFNVYGPGQALTNPYTGVLANFANWLLKGERPQVYEDGKQTRDFIYVEDVARVVAAAALGEIPAGTYNVATGVATSIRDVATGLAEALALDITPNIRGDFRPGDIRHCVGDASRLHSVMPSFAPLPLSFGLQRYADGLRSARPRDALATTPPSVAPLRLV